MNVEVIKERCVGNCALCTIHKNHPEFDYYSCVLNQIFQRTIAIERKQDELLKLFEQQKMNHLNQTIYDYDNDNKNVPDEQKEEKRVLEQSGLSGV